jgi:hypothetical protein
MEPPPFVARRRFRALVPLTSVCESKCALFAMSRPVACACSCLAFSAAACARFGANLSDLVVVAQHLRVHAEHVRVLVNHLVEVDLVESLGLRGGEVSGEGREALDGRDAEEALRCRHDADVLDLDARALGVPAAAAG